MHVLTLIVSFYLQHTSLLLGVCAHGAVGRNRTAPELSSGRALSGGPVRQRSRNRVRRTCQPLATRNVGHLLPLRPWLSHLPDHAGVVGRRRRRRQRGCFTSIIPCPYDALGACHESIATNTRPITHTYSPSTSPRSHRSPGTVPSP